MEPPRNQESDRSRRHLTPIIGDVFAELDRVTTPEGVQASDWRMFRGAVFGRDSAQVGLDIVDVLPHRAATIAESLAARQGRRHDDRSEEEPGRIHHEWRSLWLGRRRTDPENVDVMRLLQELWGDPASDELCYYGSVDATCLFVTLVHRIVGREGPSLLDTVVRRGDASETSIADCVREAAEWITDRTTSSDLGLLEFRRSNPVGLPWQALRDGELSYQHADGGVANADAPIASLEVQGLAHDALLAAAEIVGDASGAAWTDRARRLRAATLEHFVADDMPSGFCMAVDRHPTTNTLRQVRVETTLPGELLESSFLDRALSEADYAERVGRIVRHLFGPSMLTAVGLRARSLDHRGTLEPAPYATYQGSLTSWPVMTNIVSRGLARIGLPRLAADLDRRILDGIGHSGTFAEAWFVDEDGAVEVGVDESDERAEARPLATSSTFENAQAWTISAALRALHVTGGDRPAATGWRRDLEEECLQSAAGSYLDDVPRCRFVRDHADGDRWLRQAVESVSTTP